MKKVIHAALSAGIFALAATSANAAGTKICVTTWDLTNPYWVNLVNGIKARAEELGAEVAVADPANDISKQVAALENFTSSGCKAIIVAPIDPASTKAPLGAAKAAGVKIIAQSIETPVADVWASAEEKDMGYTVGKEAGKWIADKLGGKAKVLILNNDKIPQMIARKEGIKAGITELAPKAEVVVDQGATNTSEAMNVTESALQAHPDIQVVVTYNDSIALGALAAIESSGVDSSKMFVGGIDATDEARTKIKDGTAFRATVDNVPFDNGKQDVDMAMSLVGGKKLEYRQVIAVKAYTGDK